MYQTKKVFTGLFCIMLIMICTLGSTTKKTPVFVRPITIICAYSAGSQTDLVNRALAEGMKDHLGVPVNVINMPGGLGGIAADYIWNKPHDGYQILGASERMLLLPANGGHHTTAKDWSYFMAAGVPDVLMVPAGSKYQSFKELYADIRANPGKVKIATGTKDSFSYLKWVVISKIVGIETNLVNYTTLYNSFFGAIGGEVDAVYCPLNEALKFVHEKKLRPLIVTEKIGLRDPELGYIPAITNYISELRTVFPLPQWSGLAVPVDTDKEALSKISRAFVSAMRSEPVTKLLSEQSLRPYGLFKTGYYGRSAKNISQSFQSRFCWTLVELELVKRTPSDLEKMGIDNLSQKKTDSEISK